MKPKPVPQELAIKERFEGLIELTPYSEDARKFVESANEFGKLIAPGKNEKHYTLIIFEGYNGREVLAYLESYNEDN